MKITHLRQITLLGALIAPACAAAAKVVAPQLPPAEDTAKHSLAQSPRHAEWANVALPGTTTKLHTWVVYPERKDKAPVVLVIHEIFGMTDWVRAVADQLAAEGFIAVAPDLLSGKGPGGGGTEAFAADDVRAAIGKLDPEEVTQRLNAARTYGLSLPSSTTRTASIGFCWGGSTSFAYGTRQPGLNAIVVFYGTPPSDDALATLPAPVFGFYGGDDARVTSTVPATAAAMAALKKAYTPHVFEGAGHGFLRQQSGRDGANLKAAQQAWSETLAFLKAQLEPPKPTRIKGLGHHPSPAFSTTLNAMRRQALSAAATVVCH